MSFYLFIYLLLLLLFNFDLCFPLPFIRSSQGLFYLSPMFINAHAHMGLVLIQLKTIGLWALLL